MSTDDNLGLKPATVLASMISQGQLASRELLGHYRHRIDRLNEQINAVVTFDWERAEQAAIDADQMVADGAELGPLHGVPITIKDAIATQGIRSTGGASELGDNIATQDAPVVAKLKDAGAIVFGKTNLPRWSGDIQAYNSMFGFTGNPWDLARTPGGSSGGAAAAVGAGLTGFDIGTDIGGSVRLPAHFSGVCGHKPSFGVVDQMGYLDHVHGGSTEADVNVFGPLARTVNDLSTIFEVISGPTADRATGWRLELPPPRQRHPEGLRVAAWLDDEVCPVASEVGGLLEAAASALEHAGAVVDRQARPGIGLSGVWDVGLPLISAATSPARTNEEFNDQVARADDENQDEVTRMRARASVIRHRDWLALDRQRQHDRSKWAEFFENHDVMLCPVSASAAFTHRHLGNLYTRSIPIDGVDRPYADLIAWTSFIGYAYLPSTVVPVGLTPQGLPVGIQVVAPFLEDHTGLAVAAMIENLVGGYQVPPIANLGLA